MIHASEPPGSEIAKAAAYMLNPWNALTRFVHDGRLSPDNSLTEQQLRSIALGRRNYLFLRCAWTRQDGLVAVVPVIDCGDRTVRDCEVTTSQESPAVLAPLPRALEAPESVPGGPAHRLGGSGAQTGTNHRWLHAFPLRPSSRNDHGLLGALA